MINCKINNNVNSNNYKKYFFKKFYYFLKDPALVGGLNGSVSGAIASVLAFYGYLSLPGFGPVIARGISIALSTGIIIGTIIGLIMGIIVGSFCIFLWRLYTL
ncbi:hypothetical protein [Bartonella sp. B41]